MPSSNTPLMLLACLLLLTALLTGGGTHSGFLSDAVLEIMACPILLLLAWRHLTAPAAAPVPSRRAALAFTAALLALPLLHLIPINTGLPLWPAGSLKVMADLDLVAPRAAWRPLSAAPELTWLAWLSLLPSVALFWAVAHLGPNPRRLLCALIVAVGAASVVVSFLQMTGGQNSEWRFYEVTNRQEAVGFFANRNHLAAFLYCATLFTGAGALSLISEFGALTHKREQSATIFVVALSFCLIAALTAVQAMARSRAGVLLHGLALISLIALAPPTLIVGQAQSHIRKILVLVSILSAAVFGQLLLYRFVDRFAYESLQGDARLTFLGNTLEAARAYLPFGSGLGTFVRVYGTFEKPADTLANRFANHAHNDWAELWLETGIPGLILAAVFLLWLAMQAFKLRRTPPDGEPVIDVLLQRAGVAAIVLLLLHSFVDYPIRTSAIMAVFALAAGLQIPPYPAAGQAADPKPLSKLFKRRRRHHHDADEPSHATAVAASQAGVEGEVATEAPRAVQAIESKRWEAAAPWPEAWTATPSTAALPSSPEPKEPRQVSGTRLGAGRLKDGRRAKGRPGVAMNICRPIKSPSQPLHDQQGDHGLTTRVRALEFIPVEEPRSVA